MRLLRRLPLIRWGRASRLVVLSSVVDRLWRMGVHASVKLFFLLLDEGAITHPMTLISAMNAAVGDFLPSAGVVSTSTVGVASVALLFSVVLSSGVIGFITGDSVHCLRSLHLCWRFLCPIE